ncbi:MAG: heme-binding protein [Alphaproteobacteria bacterium]|nr:heme-binding protein [Alphaproteobacteria bacterium]
MSFRLKIVAACGALALGSSAYAATGTIMWHDLSLDLAKMAAEATLAECQANGFHTAAVVVDRAGVVLVTLRDERATPQMMEMARRKAYTAKMFRRTTKDWAERTRDGQDIAPQRDLEDVLALAGGVPIQMGDETIGAVGSSGSSLVQDDACAHKGVAAIANFLK